MIHYLLTAFLISTDTKPMKVEVIKKWFDGKSRDLRAVAVKLKNKGMGVEYFAPLARLREVLEEGVI